MEAKILGELVKQVLETGDAHTLTDEQTRQFHMGFESTITNEIEEMRADKRRAYEELKNISFG